MSEQSEKFTISRRVLATFGALSAILLVIGGLFFFGLRTIERNNEEQQMRALDKLALIDDTAQDIGELQATVLREIMASDPVEITNFDNAARGIEKTNAMEMDGFKKYVDTEKEKRFYEKTMQARKAFRDQTLGVLDLAHANKDAEAIKRINDVQGRAYDELLRDITDEIEYVEADAIDTTKSASRIIARTRTAGNVLFGFAILIVIGTGFSVAKVARLLKADNARMQQEIQTRKSTEEALRGKTAFLEAQVHSSEDGLLVVDNEGKLLLQNKRFVEIFNMPSNIANETSDGKRLHWITSIVKNPEAFLEKVQYLYEHTWDVSRDVVELKDGTILDRYSSPVIGQDGKYHGRIWAFRDITKSREDEIKLRESDEKFRQLSENISDVFWVTSTDLHTVHYISPAYEQIWGRTCESLYANPKQWAESIVPEERDKVFEAFLSLSGSKTEVSIEYRIQRPDGSIRWLHDRGFQVRDTAGNVIRLAGIVADITDRKRFESQMIHSQRLETVGKLAGGVAHEFNSILTAIIGQSELALSDLPPNTRLTKSLNEIRQAAERAATLTRQLLAYGRKQMLQPKVLDMNQILAEMEKTLGHLAGDHVDVRIAPGKNLKSVKIDPGQLEQVIVNITMNAGAAMPNGGKLTFETLNATLDADYVRQFPDLKAGDYVLLAITDTGTGISPDIKKHLFEPFFTTKPVGQATGLGLATCYGILKQSGGHINAYSEVSRGATFKIYLPSVDAPKTVAAPPPATSALPRGTETILLVEDDPALREMASTLLERLGYKVLKAADGVDALDLKRHSGIDHVDLVFTDVVMPNMSGKELADRFHMLYPRTKILFTSAYTESAIVHQGVLSPGITLLPKPFTPSALAAKVREVLDRDGMS